MEEKKYNTLAEVLAAYDVAGQRFEYHDYSVEELKSPVIKKIIKKAQ